MKSSKLSMHRLRSSYICTNCLARNSSAIPIINSPSASSHSKPKLYSTSTLTNPPSKAFARLPSRRLISLHGPDTTKFLQGLVSYNVTPPSTIAHGGFYTAFLNGQGRLLNDVFIYRDTTISEDNGWFIEVDANEAEKLFKHLKKYKLRSKFVIKLIPDGEMNVWSVWDGESGSAGKGWTKHALIESTKEDGGKRPLGCDDRRAPGMGRRLLLQGNNRPEVDLEEVSEELYTIRRYLKGVPEGQSEMLREASLPQESNVDFMGGIDYRKGCYVGQELTIRTYHTGVVRKRILPVMLYGVDEPEPSSLEFKKADLASEVPPETNFGRVDKKGRSAGKWLKGIGNIGLGLCRLEIMTNVVIQEGTAGYKEGDEFKLEWSSSEEASEGNSITVKAKAFVPGWHLRTGRGGLDKA